MNKEIEYFVENISLLVSSGVDIVQGLRSIQSGVRSRRLSKAIDACVEDIEAGYSLWRAFERTKLFSSHVISLMKVGEESGRLVENLKIIALQQRKDRIFRQRIFSAMMYPVFILFVTVIIGGVVAWFILPKLSKVFTNLKIDLPLTTKLLIGSGAFLNEYGVIVVPAAILAFVAVIMVLFVLPKTKFIGQAIMFRTPAIQGLIREVELTRFGFILGTLLGAGLSISEALDSLCQTTTSYDYVKFYRFLSARINEGDTFSQSFATYRRMDRLMPAPTRQMIVSAEQSGHLADTLSRISQTFEEKTEMTTKNLSVILEPVLLVIVWLGVVFVALAVIQPIYGLIGGFSQGGTSSPPPVTETVSEIPIETASSTPLIPAATSTPQNTSTPETVVLSPELPRLRIADLGQDHVNVRQAATTSSEIVGTIYAGETYNYEETANGWYHIQLQGGGKGWVAGLYVETVGD